jgi:L-aminopeptidase/D-esterase-like protein
VPRVHAVVLSGGSAYGLAAADGVMAWLEERGRGFPVPGAVVPIVPAAVVFDLGRGGDVAARPVAATGRAAADAAADGPVQQGAVGAGTGAVAGGLKGGTGTASVRLDDGSVVAALAVVNAAGSAVDPASGLLLGARALPPGEAPEVTAAGRAALRAVPRPAPALGRATTLAVVATDAALDKAGCRRLATMGHDGLARALSPVHTVLDGDVVFGLATGARPAPDVPGLLALHAAAADVVTRAVARGVLAARSTTTPGGSWPGTGSWRPREAVERRRRPAQSLCGFRRSPGAGGRRRGWRSAASSSAGGRCGTRRRRRGRSRPRRSGPAGACPGR